MEFHQLRYVCAIAETGSFSRAAERCQIAQPSLSQQVLKLEEDLGAKLFDRLGRSIRLTEAGRAFLPHARSILEQMEAARSSVAEKNTDVRGSVAVGRDSNDRAVPDAALHSSLRKEDIPKRNCASSKKQRRSLSKVCAICPSISRFLRCLCATKTWSISLSAPNRSSQLCQKIIRAPPQDSFRSRICAESAL